jgi:hypothetical protein
VVPGLAKTGVIAEELFLPALNGRGGLALTFLGGFFVELAPMDLGEDARLFAGALKAPQGDIEGLIFPDSY